MPFLDLLDSYKDNKISNIENKEDELVVKITVIEKKQDELVGQFTSQALKIMIFTEGTILGPTNFFQHFNHASYVPIGNSIEKIMAWEQQGAEIIYFTSRKKEKQVNNIRKILINYNFPGKLLYYCAKNEKYKDVVEVVLPDILIEDDCKSIGGKWQMCITHVNTEIKNKIKSVVVKEFMGIDHLPSLISELLK